MQAKIYLPSFSCTRRQRANYKRFISYAFVLSMRFDSKLSSKKAIHKTKVTDNVFCLDGQATIEHNY